MSFIFFLTLKHIYAAASFPPVPVQHEYAHDCKCIHTHTHTPLHRAQILASWSLELMQLDNFQTATKQMLGMLLLKQHQKNLCVGLVSSHWTKSGLIYSKHFTQTSTVTSNHEHSDLTKTLESSASKSFLLQGRKSSSKGNCLPLVS